MVQLFWRATWPALALILPEVWQDGFTWIRTTEIWPWLQVGVWLCLALAVILSVPWRRILGKTSTITPQGYQSTAYGTTTKLDVPWNPTLFHMLRSEN